MLLLDENLSYIYSKTSFHPEATNIYRVGYFNLSMQISCQVSKIAKNISDQSCLVRRETHDSDVCHVIEIVVFQKF